MKKNYHNYLTFNYLSRTEFPNRSLITSLVNTNTDPEEERLSRKVLLQNPQNKVISWVIHLVHTQNFPKNYYFLPRFKRG